MADGNDNGRADQGVKSEPVDLVTITYNRTTDNCHVELRCISLDAAIDLLHRALRTLENEWRKAKMVEFQRAASEQARTAAIMDQVVRDKHPR